MEKNMRICKVQLANGQTALGWIDDANVIRVLTANSLVSLLHAPDPIRAVNQAANMDQTAVPLSEAKFLAPVDQQEIWAAGVTYKRSQQARMTEAAGPARFYDLVYDAPRPELFFKAPAYRVRSPGEHLHIRRDSKWNVPEPELALVISPQLKLVGFTIGNDMSSRDIEGENPLSAQRARRRERVRRRDQGLGDEASLRGVERLARPRNELSQRRPPPDRPRSA